MPTAHCLPSLSNQYLRDDAFLSRVQLRKNLQNKPAWNLILDPPLLAFPISDNPGSPILGSYLFSFHKYLSRQGETVGPRGGRGCGSIEESPKFPWVFSIIRF